MDLESWDIVAPIAANDLGQSFHSKTLLYCAFVTKDQESTLRKVTACGFGELLGR